MKEERSTFLDEDYLEDYGGRDALAEDMLFCTGRPAVSLDGPWHYAVDQYDTCLRQRWFAERGRDGAGRSLPLDHSFEEWPVMELPRCWNTAQREYLLYEGPMVFTRRFRCPPAGDRRVFLRIGAAAYTCRVFLNGRFVGAHKGASTPFFLERTELLAEENRILLSVDSTRRPRQVPALNTDWFNYGGVFREISLIYVPRVFIRSFRIGLLPDGSLRRIRPPSSSRSLPRAAGSWRSPSWACGPRSLPRTAGAKPYSTARRRCGARTRPGSMRSASASERMRCGTGWASGRSGSGAGSCC